MYLLCLLSLLFLGRLCGLVQSKPGAALDDPWPTGCVKGSARTPLPIHVSHTHTLCPHVACLDPTFVIVLLTVPKFSPVCKTQNRGSKSVTRLHGQSGNVFSPQLWIRAPFPPACAGRHRGRTSRCSWNECLNVCLNGLFLCVCWFRVCSVVRPAGGSGRGANYELSIFSHHGTAAVSLSSTVL